MNHYNGIQKRERELDGETVRQRDVCMEVTLVDVVQSSTRCRKSPSLTSLISLSSFNSTDVDTAV